MMWRLSQQLQTRIIKQLTISQVYLRTLPTIRSHPFRPMSSAAPEISSSTSVPITLTKKRSRSHSQIENTNGATNDVASSPVPVQRRLSSRNKKQKPAEKEVPSPSEQTESTTINGTETNEEMPPCGHAALPSPPLPVEIECDTQELMVDVSQEIQIPDDEMKKVDIEPDAITVSEKVTLVRKRSKKKVTATLVYDETRYAPQALVSQFWVGAHMSGAGGVHHAIENAALIGAKAFALDLKSKRKWQNPPLAPEEAQLFQDKLKEFKMTPEQVLPHGSYLMNIGSPNDEVYKKSKANLLDELQRMKAMGLIYWNFHPGSSCGEITKEESMTKIAQTLNWVHKQTEDPALPTNGVVTVLECMAGGGGVIGSTWEELKFIIDLIEDKRRVGVCIDTCHAFAAGYDLRTPEAVAAMIQSFDKIVGLKYLKGLHLNDSKGVLGCHKDRHESIGRGEIGLEGFRAIMNSKQFHRVPMILETPIIDATQWIQKYSKEVADLYGLEVNALKDDRLTKQFDGYTEPTEAELEELQLAKKEKSLAARERKKKRKAEASASQEEEEEDENEDQNENDDDEEDATAEPPVPPPTKRRSSAFMKRRSNSSTNQTTVAAPAIETPITSSKEETIVDDEAAAAGHSNESPSLEAPTKKLKRSSSLSQKKVKPEPE